MKKSKNKAGRASSKKVLDAGFQKLLDEMLAKTGGPPTASEVRWADKALGIKPKRKRKS